MATAALVVLGVFLTVIGIWGYVFGHSVEAIWLIGLGIVALIAAGVLQLMMSRRT